MKPKSLANLVHNGQPQTYDEPKRHRRLTVTNIGWDGIQAIAAEHGISVSELLEKLGRKQLAVVDLEELEDRLDIQDALEAEAKPENQERIPWEQIRQELGL